jgi:hypothetical protein
VIVVPRDFLEQTAVPVSQDCLDLQEVQREPPDLLDHQDPLDPMDRQGFQGLLVSQDNQAVWAYRERRVQLASLACPVPLDFLAGMGGLVHLVLLGQ